MEKLEVYESPEMEIIFVEENDVIVASPYDPIDSDDPVVDPFPDDDDDMGLINHIKL